MVRFYLLLTVLGVILPYSAFVPWLAENGVNLSAIFQAAIENRISMFAWLDVVVAAIVLIGFIISDGKRNQVQRCWLAILGTVTIGVSCGLPLYLYLREKQLQKG